MAFIMFTKMINKNRFSGRLSFNCQTYEIHDETLIIDMKNINFYERNYLFVLWKCCTKLWSASLREDANELAFIGPPASNTSLRPEKTHYISIFYLANRLLCVFDYGAGYKHTQKLLSVSCITTQFVFLQSIF